MQRHLQLITARLTSLTRIGLRNDMNYVDVSLYSIETGMVSLNNVVICSELLYCLNDNLGKTISIVYRKSYGTIYVKLILSTSSNDDYIVHKDENYQPLTTGKLLKLALAASLITFPISITTGFKAVPFVMGVLVAALLVCERRYYKINDERLTKQYLANFLHKDFNA